MARTISTKNVAIILVVFIALMVFLFAVMWSIWPSAAFVTFISRFSGASIGCVGMIAAFTYLIIRARRTNAQSGGITYGGSVTFLSVYLILLLIVTVVAYTNLDLMSYLTGLAYGILSGTVGLAIVRISTPKYPSKC